MQSSCRVYAGNIDFERCVATPEMMSVVGRAARVLGPRGLMPNAKVGSVTRDVGAAVKAAKGGQLQFRAGKNGVLHVGIGKVRSAAGACPILLFDISPQSSLFLPTYMLAFLPFLLTTGVDRGKAA